VAFAVVPERGYRHCARRLHEHPLRQTRVVQVPAHVVEHVELEHRVVLGGRRGLLSVDGVVAAVAAVGGGGRRRVLGARLAALELLHGLGDCVADVVQAAVRGRPHREEPGGVGEVEAGARTVDGEHGGVVRARSGLGGVEGAEPETAAAPPGHAHLAHPPPGIAAPPDATEDRVPRLTELGPARGLLGRRHPQGLVVLRQGGAARGARAGGAHHLLLDWAHLVSFTRGLACSH
jgi:hypothetical protein